MDRKPIIQTIENDNDGFLVITVKGPNAEEIAEVIKKALENMKNESIG